MTRFFILAILGLQVLSPGSAHAQDAKPKPFQEYLHPLKGDPAGLPKLTLVGPQAREFVKLEPEGVRITLPAGFEGERPHHGVNSGMAVQGDFEITASFEVLQEPDAGEAGAKVHLVVQLERPPSDLAGFSRHLRPNTPTKFTTWCNRHDEDTGKFKQPIKWFNAKSTKWRFRLARTGAVLSYFLAEDGEADFRLLQQFTWYEDDLKDVRLLAQTGGPQASLDVRVTDLHIRAESLPNLVKAAERSEGALPVGGDWRIWLTAGIAVILIVGVALAVRQSRRRGSKDADKAAPPAMAPTLGCPGCGKGIKYKSTMAGKKVKCPHCGQVIHCAE